jgi:hypothetical protein
MVPQAIEVIEPEKCDVIGYVANTSIPKESYERDPTISANAANNATLRLRL